MTFNRTTTGFLLGLAAFLVLLLMPQPERMTVNGQRVLAVGVLLAVWWIFETLPMPVTALLPVILFPLFGVMSTPEATVTLGHHVNFIILGGFFIAAAIEKWALHRRIALTVIRKIGTSPAAIMLGFMIASFSLSMWISNVATAMMMVPIGLSVIDQVLRFATMPGSPEGLQRQKKRFGVGLMLCIAYAVNLGGMSTLIGTPCNAVLAGLVSETYGQEIDFLDWLLVAFPLAALLLILTWLCFTRVLFRAEWKFDTQDNVIEKELLALGPITRPERLTLAVLGAAIFCWVARGLIASESLKLVNDATVAIFFGVALFLIPANRERTEFLLDWKSAAKVPWGILLLMGGGLTLAKGIQVSQLDQWLVGTLSGLGNSNLYLTVMAVTALTILMTEVNSNTATVTILVPFLGSMAAALSIHPFALIMASGIAASFTFMLPIGTPGNMVIFGSNHVTVGQMMRSGVALDILGILLIPLLVLYFLPLVLNIDLDVIPPWALRGSR